MEIEIKGDRYRNKRILAPMVRTGSLPMRLTVLDYGADLVYSPEIVDKRIIGSERVWNEQAQSYDYMKKGKVNFRTVPREKNHLIFQLGTADEHLALEAAKTVLQDISGVDVNCGCPKRFSIQGGMGAALLTNPDKLEKILTNLVQNLPVPVTCKIRLLNTREETLNLIKRIEKTGVHAIAVHCRTRDERPAQPAHWEELKYIVDQVKSIPIIANGDLFRPEDIVKVKEQTGVSSVMIARGAMKNPSIFSKDGLVDFKQTVAKYIQHATDLNFLYQNTKYTLSQMYDDPKSEEFRSLHKAKSIKDICIAFGQLPYYEKVQQQIEARMGKKEDVENNTELNSESNSELNTKSKDESNTGANGTKRPLDNETTQIDDLDIKKSKIIES
ncbi:FMN-linked oxidoreductase [Neoconidiobolus thromboides FSU 785]|nr:FMN-linked oxidoreductase [Neoconidiobolus thromboides FSU 785]